jgi:hypothetical protein
VTETLILSRTDETISGWHNEIHVELHSLAAKPPIKYQRILKSVTIQTDSIPQINSHGFLSLSFVANPFPETGRLFGSMQRKSKQ